MNGETAAWLPWIAWVALGLALFWQGRRLAALQRRLAAGEAELADLRAWKEASEGQFAQVALDASALRASTVGFGQQLERLERAQGLLESHLGSVQHNGVQEANYAQAIRLAARGQVDVESLVRDYGLPRGEAELLLRMHRKEDE
ncbi:MAG: DUF2802 domain-containing protein [Pseudomonadota bacterium]